MIISVWLVAFASLIWLPKDSLGQFLDNDCGFTVPLPPRSRIYGGRAAVIGSSPWMAYLTHNSTFICGGTLINTKYILTAAHCMENGRQLKVRLGEYDTRTSIDCSQDFCIPQYEEYDVALVIKNSNYRLQHGGSYDIGLLKLTRPVRYKIHIRPVCLLLSPSRAAHNPTFVATGWGKTNVYKVATVLQTVILRKFSPTECERVLRTSLEWGQFCAGQEEADTCDGDSGGPLVQKLSDGRITRTVQFGIVSYGHYLCRGPGVYTDVMAFTDWIRRAIHIYGI